MPASRPVYPRFLNLLVALGLATINIRGRTNHIGLTELGVSKANELSEREENSDIAARTKVIKRHFDMGGTNLMKFVYDTFPEIETLRFGEEIRHEN